MNNDVPDPHNLPVLSADVELRARGTDLVGVRQAFSPLAGDCVRDLMVSLNTLRQLAQEAHERGDFRAECKIASRICALTIKALRLVS